MNTATQPKLLPSRIMNRTHAKPYLRKVELDGLIGHRELVLATAIGHAILIGMERKERGRLLRTFLLIVSGLVTFIGVTQLAIQLQKG